MRKRNRWVWVLLLSAAVVLTSCNSTEESEDNSIDREVRTSCGTVREERIQNPVNLGDGVRIQVEEITGPDQLVYSEVRDTENRKHLLKILGLSTTTTNRAAAINYLRSLTFGTLYLFESREDCTATVEGGGVAKVGSVVSEEGWSLAEQGIRSGLIAPENSSNCGTDLVGSCLATLQDTDPVTEGPLQEFLWKPISDSDGKLAVHTSPGGTTVIVNGEVGTNQGAGNGFGALARFSRAGCGYPNPQIRVIDTRSGLAYTVGGRTTFTVPNPCGRYCLRGGEIVSCPKN